jgi:hypothetical protein
VIERSIENAISAVPFELEEGSYALGATKWQTISMITLPTAVSGIITGAILGFGRAAEESAVVILTAGYSQFMPEFTIKSNPNLLFGIKIYPIQDLIGTLPYAVYHAYENSNVIKESNGFAAAVILISIVILVNFSAKFIIIRAMPGKGLEGGSGGSWFDTVKTVVFSRKKDPEEMITLQPSQKKNDDLIAPVIPSSKIPNTDVSVSVSQDKSVSSKNEAARENSVPVTSFQDKSFGEITPSAKKTGKKFLLALLPFTIPAALLLLIAFLATIPPFHHALGKASPFLAGVFATTLSLIIVVTGLVFALLLAKRSGAFKKKTRRIGYAGVITGFCLVCIAGIICASAAAGVFSTGTEPAKTPTGDRNAQLAALLAASEPGSDQPAGSEVQVQEPAVQVPATPVPGQGNYTTVSLPLKNALSIGESYTWGDAQHTSRATIYDYKVLPFYFWWWIDYNRFVPQIPPAGKSYLVLFVRMENIGTESSVIPSADSINVSYKGNSTGRLAYLNTSVISTWQFNQLGSENRREQYYQWIREIGQNKRDYAYLTGENLFKGGNSTSDVTVTPTVTVSTASASLNLTTKTSSTYNGAYLKPGRSQAIDGYLIFEVPDEAMKHINETYVDVSFNSLSRGRWKLGY